MRVKIRGEITPQRLAEAFELALSELQAASPGAKVYGANLYLSPFDADGLEFELADAHGNEVMIDVAAPAGTLVKPGLSAEAQVRIDQTRETSRQQKAKDRVTRDNLLAERDRMERRRMEHREKAEAAYRGLNKLTEELLTSQPEHFIAELNETVRSTWESLKPTEPHGAKKGELKPMPVFSVFDGRLLMMNSAWKNARSLVNPVGNLKNHEITPIWSFNAWAVATAGFLRVMERLNGSLPEEILGPNMAIMPIIKPSA